MDIELIENRESNRLALALKNIDLGIEWLDKDTRNKAYSRYRQNAGGNTLVL